MQNITQPSPPHSSPRRVDALLEHYGQSHQDPRNSAIHCLAIPLIMLSLCGLLAWLHAWLLYAFLAASMVYYARLSVVFLACMLLCSALALLLVQAMGNALLPMSVAVFVGAWVLQFIGHRIEGKKPSFFEDLQYLWVGPLFVLSKLLLRLGVRW